ncbi:tetraspanin-18B-like [Ptychodera flava]|uniref:tetraspanin-18B-like n=1 Tax=Ptychodera flava TaxID=63121 RepID=UPI003969C97A
MAGATEYLKYALIILNVILIIFGIILIAVGIWLLVEFPAFNRVLDNHLIRSSVYIIIVIGIALTLLALLSLFAAVQLSTIALGVFVALQAVVFILEWIAIGFVFYVGTADVHEYLAKQANMTLMDYEVVDSITISWDDMHRKGRCCGINGPTDFQHVAYFDDTPEYFPDSCCVENSDGSLLDRTKCHNEVTDYHFEKGCLALFEAFINDNIYVGGALAIVVALIQLGCIIVAIALLCLINDIVVYPEPPSRPEKDVYQSQSRIQEPMSEQQSQDRYDLEMEQTQRQTTSQWQEQY